MEYLTRELEIELKEKIEVLDMINGKLNAHMAGKREFGWEDQAKGLELAIAIVEGTKEGYENVLARLQGASSEND